MKQSIFLITCLIAGTITFAQDKKEKAPPPPPPVSPIIEAVKLAPPVVGMNEFYRNNPSIADEYWSKNQNLIIKFKNNSKEKHNLADDKEKNAFTEKYGKPPVALSPPPPPIPIKSWQ